MSEAELVFVPFREAQAHVRDGDLLLYRRRGLISIAGRGDHTHAAKAAWWGSDLLFLQGFNASMLDGSGPVWAVAVPVVIRYEGDAVAGADVRGFDFRELAALAPEPSW
jgi:hypothetical protein